MKDRKFLDYLQTLSCLICNQRPACGHHIKTKGSGGPDEPWNLVPLCNEHHQEVHRLGAYRFANKYIKFKKYLEIFEWELIELNGKFKYINKKGNKNVR
jgi:hypothetical protein